MPRKELVLPSFIENMQSQTVRRLQCAAETLLRVQPSPPVETLIPLRKSKTKEILAFQKLLLNSILSVLPSGAQHKHRQIQLSILQ